MKKNKKIYYGLSIGWTLALLLQIWRLYRAHLSNIPNGTIVFWILFSAAMAAAFFLKARKIE